MEFPISKERLQNFRREWLVLERTKHIDKVVEEITKQVLAIASHGGAGGNQRYVYQGVSRLHNPDHRPEMYIPLILEKLKERFPDCRVDIDPLQTYIIVDWS